MLGKYSWRNVPGLRGIQLGWHTIGMLPNTHTYTYYFYYLTIKALLLVVVWWLY